MWAASRRAASALAYAEVGAFMVDLRQRDAEAARALELAILSACRISEVLDAMWDEVDLANRL
jgi:integrase